MKKGILLAFIMTCSTILYGQGFEAYAIGGVTFSQIEGDNLSGYNNVGVMAGAASNFLLKNGFSFQQEIVYYQRGSKATNEQLTDDVFTIKNLHYIDVIALLNKVVKRKWLVQGGLGAGKLLKIKSDDANDNLSHYGLDLFGTLGGGYFFTDNLLVSVRGQFTMNTIQKDIPFIKNNSLALSMRWRFMNND